MTRPATPWPAQPLQDWVATKDTFQLYAQVIGKVRMACTPRVNHWWNVPLYVTASGLTTSYIPYQPGRGFQIDFDLLNHELVILAGDGTSRTLKPAQ